MRVESGDEVVEVVSGDGLALPTEALGRASQPDLGEPERLGAVVRHEHGAGGGDARGRLGGQRVEVGVDDGVLQRGQRRVQPV
ncbi:unnamed protein product, partial [Penicillium discolor]